MQAVEVLLRRWMKVDGQHHALDALECCCFTY
jgi:hypothetical protein